MKKWLASKGRWYYFTVHQRVAVWPFAVLVDYYIVYTGRLVADLLSASLRRS